MFLTDLLFPRVCLGCGFLGCSVCPKCQKKLSYLGKDSCLYCQRASPLGFTHQICQKKFGVDGVTGVFHYNDFLKKIISRIKYRFDLDLWNELSLTIRPEHISKLSLYQRLNRGFLIQSVPLHLKKLRTRGFNQAKIISDYFQKYLKFGKIDSLARRRETAPQAQLSDDKKRRENISGAFVATQNLREKNIILIDDVVTTGATAKEAAITLKKSGAKTVFVLALARGR